MIATNSPKRHHNSFNCNYSLSRFSCVYFPYSNVYKLYVSTFSCVSGRRREQPVSWGEIQGGYQCLYRLDFMGVLSFINVSEYKHAKC